MKRTLTFRVATSPLTAGSGERFCTLEVTCVYGRPTADKTMEPIPLTVKDMLLDGLLLNFEQRELAYALIGGEHALAALLELEDGQSPNVKMSEC